MGPSGSGKSTFLHCASGLEAPDRGAVEIGGRDLAGLGETALTELRRERIGFVFQGFNGVDLTEDGRVVARCARGPVGQGIGILDLPLPEPAPEGWQWFWAYRYWAR